MKKNRLMKKDNAPRSQNPLPKRFFINEKQVLFTSRHLHKFGVWSSVFFLFVFGRGFHLVTKIEALANDLSRVGQTLTIRQAFCCTLRPILFFSSKALSKFKSFRQLFARSRYESKWEPIGMMSCLLGGIRAACPPTNDTRISCFGFRALMLNFFAAGFLCKFSWWVSRAVWDRRLLSFLLGGYFCAVLQIARVRRSEKLGAESAQGKFRMRFMIWDR